MVFPLPIARQIASDLNSGDLAKVEVKNLEKTILFKNNQLIGKDSIINSLIKKNDIQRLIIESSNEKFSIMEKNYNFVCDELKGEKSKNKLRSYVSVGIITILTTLLIIR